MTKLIITAHRGMGTTAKPRSEFIRDSVFYPENSLNAFEVVLESGIKAIEMDIHVSKDNQAMVIHGNDLIEYARFLGEHTANIMSSSSSNTSTDCPFNSFDGQEDSLCNNNDSSANDSSALDNDDDFNNFRMMDIKDIPIHTRQMDSDNDSMDIVFGKDGDVSYFSSCI